MHRRMDGHIGSQASRQAGREQVDGQVHEKSGMGGTRGEEIQGEEVSVGQRKRMLDAWSEERDTVEEMKKK